MSRRARPRETTFEIFWYVALALEIYHLDETLKLFKSDVAHHLHKEITVSNNDKNKNKF